MALVIRIDGLVNSDNEGSMEVVYELKIIINYLQTYFYIIILIENKNYKSIIQKMIERQFQIDCIYIYDQIQNQICNMFIELDQIQRDIDNISQIVFINTFNVPVGIDNIQYNDLNQNE